jgi:hypothetical protein
MGCPIAKKWRKDLGARKLPNNLMGRRGCLRPIGLNASLRLSVVFTLITAPFYDWRHSDEMPLQSLLPHARGGGWGMAPAFLYKYAVSLVVIQAEF